MDRRHQAIEPLEHPCDVLRLPAAPAGDPLAVNRLDEDPAGRDLAVTDWDSRDSAQAAEGPRLARHLDAAEPANRRRLVGEVFQVRLALEVRHFLDVGLGPAPALQQRDTQAGFGGRTDGRAHSVLLCYPASDERERHLTTSPGVVRATGPGPSGDG